MRLSGVEMARLITPAAKPIPISSLADKMAFVADSPFCRITSFEASNMHNNRKSWGNVHESRVVESGKTTLTLIEL